MKPLSCLIVEDQVEFVQLLQKMLEKFEDIEVVGVRSDTVGAVMQIERTKPDVVFLDINISGLEGPEFIDLLEHRPKIVVISSHEESYMKNYPDVDYIDFIQKPPTYERLQDAIEKCRWLG